MRDLFNIPFASVIVGTVAAMIGLYWTYTGLASLRGRSVVYLLMMAYMSYALQDLLTGVFAVGLILLNAYIWYKGERRRSRTAMVSPFRRS